MHVGEHFQTAISNVYLKNILDYMHNLTININITHAILINTRRASFQHVLITLIIIIFATHHQSVVITKKLW